TDAYVIPPNPYINQEITLGTTFTNIGDQPAQNFYLHIIIDGSYIHPFGYFIPINPGQSSTPEITLNAGDLSIGMHSVKYWVDATEVVLEITEENNISEIKF